MRYRVFALVFAAATMTFGSAHSGDLPTPPYPAAVPPPAVYDALRFGPWSGIYLGGNVGYGWANATGDYTLANNAFTNGTFAGSPINLDGVNGGLQVGYNWQIGNLLLGVEGDFQGAGQNLTSNSSCGLNCFVSETAKIDWFSTFRGRAGFTIKDVLFYGTGGLNWTHGENNFSGTLNGTSGNLANFTHDSLGWVAGGGIEWMFWYGWSAKIEYLFLRNSGSNSTVTVPASLGGGTLANSADASNNVVRVGLNYHFFFPYGGAWPYYP
jgi:outer membrane immunogenic protein